MKILFAHDHTFYTYNNKFYSNGGLSEKVLKRYKLSPEKVTLVSRQKSVDRIEGNMSEVSESNYSFVKIENFKTLSSAYKIFEARKKINDYVKQADLVIARLPSSIGMIAIKTAKKQKKPYVIEVVGCPFDSLWNYGGILPKIIAPLSYISMRYIVSGSENTLYVTNEYLQKKYPSRGRKVSCSNVEIPYIDSFILKNRKEKIKLGIRDDLVKIGVIGGLNNQYKGFDTAIKALKLLEKDNINAVLEIVGMGSRDVWENLALDLGMLDKVNFIGSLEQGEEVFKWLDGIDLYIQPSKTEGLPRALIEAMSRGCPAVGSRAGGIPELLDNDFLHAIDNEVELSNKMIKIIGNESLQLKLACRNFDKAKEYSKELLDSKRDNFFKSVFSEVDKNVRINQW